MTILSILWSVRRIRSEQLRSGLIARDVDQRDIALQDSETAAGAEHAPRSHDLGPAQDRDHLLCEQLHRLDSLLVDSAAENRENMARAATAALRDDLLGDLG